MISHVVLFKPRAHLSPAARRRLVAAFARATREIPGVRAVRIGRRVSTGAGYEAAMPDTADYLVALDFDDVKGVQRYLTHPAHADLGRRFRESASARLIFDFEWMALDGFGEQTEGAAAEGRAALRSRRPRRPRAPGRRRSGR